MLRSSRGAFRPALVRPRSPCVRQMSVETVTETIAPLKTTLEGLQQASGLSWSVFIPLATVSIRATLTTPLAVWNRIRARRQARLQPLLGAMVPVLKAQLAQSVVRDKSPLTAEQIVVLASKERRRRRVKLYRQFNCQNWKVLLLPTVQIPVFVAMSLAIRSLVGFDLTQETDFGNLDASRFLWYRNMVEPDPYGIIPLFIGACSLGNVELNAAATPTKRQGPSVAAAVANASRAGSIVFMALSFQAPVALELYWLSSNAYSLLQNILLERYLPVHEPIEYPKLDPAVLNR